jgi:carboxypeptidase T
MLSSRRRTAAVAAAAAMALLPAVQYTVSAAPAPGAPRDGRAVYSIPGTDSAKRTDINKTGAQVLSQKNGTATVEATPEQADALRKAGFPLRFEQSVAATLAKRGKAAPGDFPVEDRGYHNYDEVQAELDQIAQAHPEIAQKGSIGKTHEGRDVPMLKISDNVARDEEEPEVLFDCNQHAREHLTTEMCLHIAQRFTTDPAVKDMVDNREIYVIPVVNVDGAIKDLEGGRYNMWRKTTEDGHGTDPNRNYDYKWNCCGGSSDDPEADDYHGTGPASTVEVQNLQKFVDSRVINGKQQIKAHIDFHTYSELVMWPFGHTQDQVTDGMTQAEYDRFVEVGTEMAKTNGYTPEQSSALYVTDGDITDWMWGKHKIFTFVFEMYPGEGGADGFYPPDEVIPQETTRNDQAVDIMMREAGV